MFNGNARIIVFVLVAMLLTDWAQPWLAQACACVPAAAEADPCGMTSARGNDACCAVGAAGSRVDGTVANHGSSRDGSQPHGQTADQHSGQSADTGSSTCSMKVCPSIVAPVLATGVSFAIAPPSTEYVIVPHMSPVPAPPSRGLFHPPKLSTIWG